LLENRCEGAAQLHEDSMVKCRTLKHVLKSSILPDVTNFASACTNYKTAKLYVRL